MSTPSNGVYQTTAEEISETAFYAVLWLCVGLCIIGFSLRSYIRFLCFRGLLVDDYLMLLALTIMTSLAIIGQVYLKDVYLLTHVENGLVAPGPDFFDRVSAGLRSVGLWLLLSIIGIWVIKLNFLLFFYRIGHQLTEYLIFWWISLVVVTGCGLAGIGIIPYSCMFGDILNVIVQCSSETSLAHIYTVYKASVILDVCSDAIIICFPVAILWKARIELRQKLLLSAIFCLVGFTIGVTIIRGSIFGGVYKSLESVETKAIDSTWVMFWFWIEYTVSFIVACLISFRSLWARREQKAREAERRRIAEESPQSPTPQRPARTRLQRLHDSVLDTFNDFEDGSINQMRVLNRLPSEASTGDPPHTDKK